jgi:hypothetical protein
MALGGLASLIAKTAARKPSVAQELAMNKAIKAIEDMPSNEVYKARAESFRAKELGREQPIPSLTKSNKDNQQIIAEYQQGLKKKGSGFKDERIPELEQSVKNIDEGTQTVEGHAKLVQKHKPIKTHKKSPTVIKAEEIPFVLRDGKYLEKGARNKNSGIYNYDLKIPEEQRALVRLDIPAYMDFNKWVAALNLPGFKKGTYYSPTARLKDVKFKHGTGGAKKVAKGEKSKFPFATMDGKWVNHNPNEIQEIVDDILKKRGSEWVQVGYDPRRHGHFYTREPFRVKNNTIKKGSPIEEAEEVIQVGPLVLARKPTFSDIVAYKKGGQVMKNYYKNYNTQRAI